MRISWSAGSQPSRARRARILLNLGLLTFSVNAIIRRARRALLGYSPVAGNSGDTDNNSIFLNGRLYDNI